MRFFLALVIGKILTLISVFSGRGTNIVGVAAIKICPDFLSRIKLNAVFIAVSGTNGKTTTANLMTHTLKNAGHKVVSNDKGSNMASGVATALIKSCSAKGRINAGYVVMEVDERSIQYIFPQMSPDIMLVTNLFRDSIYRNGHSQFIFSKMQMALNPKIKMFLNANDPISNALGFDNKIFFGVEKTGISTQTSRNLTNDLLICPDCFRTLGYKFYHYHHIGEYGCECGFGMPKADYAATDVDLEKSVFKIDGMELKIPNKNLFNVFNYAGAAAVLRYIGLDKNMIKEGFSSFNKLQGRFEQSGKTTLMVCKNQNPVSASQGLSFINRDGSKKAVYLMITDPRGADVESEDISWLYDVDFWLLKDDSVEKIILTGARTADLGLVLTLQGIEKEKIITANENLSGYAKDIEKVYIMSSLYSIPKARKLKSEIV